MLKFKNQSVSHEKLKGGIQGVALPALCHLGSYFNAEGRWKGQAAPKPYAGEPIGAISGMSLKATELCRRHITKAAQLLHGGHWAWGFSWSRAGPARWAALGSLLHLHHLLSPAFWAGCCNRMKCRVTPPSKPQSILCMEDGVQGIWRQRGTMWQRLLAADGNIHSPFSHRVPGFWLAQGEPELKLHCPLPTAFRNTT